jgi:Ca-activated chloride channel family protein
VYYYIDGEQEAEKVFCTDLLGTLYTVAEDVKLQLTFDSDLVAAYRLIGYENRLLNEDDFTDDTKDAGDMGSGHTVTVCYEIKLTDTTANVDSFATIAIRYKQPDGIKSELEEYNVTKAHLTSTPDKEQQFVATVVEFSMLLRGSKFANKETTTLENLISRLEALNLDNEKAELLDIMKKLS